MRGGKKNRKKKNGEEKPSPFTLSLFLGSLNTGRNGHRTIFGFQNCRQIADADNSFDRQRMHVVYGLERCPARVQPFVRI